MSTAKLTLKNMSGELVRVYDLTPLGFVPVAFEMDENGDFELTGPESQTGVVEQDGLDDQAQALPAGTYTATLDQLDEPAVIASDFIQVIIG